MPILSIIILDVCCKWPMSNKLCSLPYPESYFSLTLNSLITSITLSRQIANSLILFTIFSRFSSFCKASSVTLNPLPKASNDWSSN